MIILNPSSSTVLLTVLHDVIHHLRHLKQTQYHQNFLHDRLLLQLATDVTVPPTVCPCGQANDMANLLAKGVSTVDGVDDDGSTVAKIDSNLKQSWKVMVMVGCHWNMLVVLGRRK
ncbi:hypothetical protein L6452_37410 [Arctium lappa]|uniref:Uncharacterized protein n=1 Tax=Arctium lappa TaxID=4217 RepID=A0ACB8Y2W4_ARCLA|nr:hypothetical protein L6452_37410 [Arctium lappa]